MDLSIIIIILGLCVGFFVQTIAGFAATLVALPILLLVMNLQDAIALLAIFHLIFSLILIRKNYAQVDKRVAVEIIIGGTIGLFIGIQVLKLGDPDLLKQLLGIFIVTYAVHAFAKQEKSIVQKKAHYILTLLGGFFSGLYAAGGPLFAVYIYNRINKATVIRATLIGAFMALNIFRIPMLAANKLIDIRVLHYSLAAFPLFLVAIYFGDKMHSKINEELFKKIFLILLLLAGISLIF